jgi:hypothetical protein
MATVLRGMKSGKGGKLTLTAKGPVYTESSEFIIVSDVKNESIANVLSTTGLPRVNFTLTTFDALCRDLTPKQDAKSPYVWRVVADFTTEPLEYDTGSDDPDSPDPTTWVPIYKGVVETMEEVVYEDFSSTPKKYVNSAKKKFPEPLVVKRPIIVYSFQQFVASTYTDVQIGDWNDTINTASFKSFPADTLHLTVQDFERGTFYGVDCTLVSFRVAYNKQTWLNKPLDMGYEYRPSAGDPTVGSPGGKLVALESDGTLRDDTLEPLALEFVPHRRIAFATGSGGPLL